MGIQCRSHAAAPCRDSECRCGNFVPSFPENYQPSIIESLRAAYRYHKTHSDQAGETIRCLRILKQYELVKARSRGQKSREFEVKASLDETLKETLATFVHHHRFVDSLQEMISKEEYRSVVGSASLDEDNIPGSSSRCSENKSADLKRGKCPNNREELPLMKTCGQVQNEKITKTEHCFGTCGFRGKTREAYPFENQFQLIRDLEGHTKGAKDAKRQQYVGTAHFGGGAMRGDFHFYNKPQAKAIPSIAKDAETQQRVSTAYFGQGTIREEFNFQKQPQLKALDGNMNERKDTERTKPKKTRIYLGRKNRFGK